MGQIQSNGSPQDPLRIAFYSPALPESGVSNGIVTYTRIMRDALRALGHGVMIFTADHLEHPDGRVVELPKPNRISGRIRTLLESRHQDGSHPWTRLRILDGFREARRLGADVVEIEESFGWAGRLAGQGVAIVERLHGPHTFIRDRVGTAQHQRLGDLREAAELASFGAVQAVTSPTQRLLDVLIAQYGLDLPIARAIPNPIPVAPASKRWRLEAANPDQILCVGRFDLVKGADIIVRTFAQAFERRPSLSLVMAGPDPGLAQPDGSTMHYEEFAAMELSSQTRDRISFLGPQSPEHIAELRLQSGFSLTGSNFENFPYSIAEAMAVGMPVLTTDTFGGSEMIRDDVEGRIVPAGDLESMADAMVEMASNPARLAGMGRAAHVRAAYWLLPERIARESVEVYRQAMAALKR